MKKAVFLDKDGTLVRNVPYNVDPARIVITDGAIDALRRLHDRGFVFVVVSNQPGVAQGHFAMDALDAVEARLRTLLSRASIELLGFYWCTHNASTGFGDAAACDCRKPAPGLLLQAAKEHGIDLARSWMVGDILDDVEAGARAGCRTVLLNNGGETLWERYEERAPDCIASTFAEAAAAILAGSDEPALQEVAA
jgi:histidinol-phosphate phosphatase family protein